MSLLEVDGFTLGFVQYARGLRRRRLDVITGLDLHVDPSELVAVVGASGSGKSLLAHALLGLLPANAREGERLTYDGAPLTRQRRPALRGREIPPCDCVEKKSPTVRPLTAGRTAHSWYILTHD